MKLFPSRRSRSRLAHRSIELLPLESRLLMCAAGDHDGDAPLPDFDLGTYPAIVNASTTTTSTSSTPAAAALPLTSVPVLSSRPGAKASIYLDFNGDTTSSWGSYAPGTTPAFSQDTDATTFSSGEISAIQEIWARVAEKYSPFNINVTTVDPGTYANGVSQHVVIGGAGAWLGAQAGGVSYISSFTNSAPNTSFVFSQNLANTAKYIAEAAAHEVGHSLGLQHQSTWSGTTLTNEYNPGTSAKAPTMGNSYSATRGLWWNGANDISSTTIQDDMSVIASSTNGFGYRSDDYANAITGAFALTPSSNSVTASGVIEKTSDADYFGFNSGAGTVSFTANPASVGGMLDLKLELRNSSGTLLSAADTSALGETLSFTLPAAGTYYVDVASHGSYGDVGQYTLSGSIQPAAAVTVSAPTSLTATPVHNSTSTVNLAWADNASNETAFYVQRSANGGSTWSTLATLGANAISYTDATGQAGATYLYRVYAASGSVNSTYSNTATALLAPAQVSGLAATASSSSAVNLSWSAAAGAAGYRVERYNPSTASWLSLGTTTSTSFSAGGLSASTNYQFRVFATNSTGDSPASATASATTQAAPVTLTPAAPSNLVLRPLSTTQIRLDWKNNATNATGISVESSLDGANWFVLANIGANWTAGVDSQLSPGKTYWYRLRAYNSYGYSAYSNVASATTPAAAQVAPAQATTTPPTPAAAPTSALFSNQPIQHDNPVLDSSHGHSRAAHGRVSADDVLRRA